MYATKSPGRRGYGRGAAIAFLAITCGGVSIFLVQRRVVVSSDQSARAATPQPEPDVVAGGGIHERASETAQRSERARRTIDLDGEPRARALTFEHDFGLVRPHERVRHVFAIHNDSESSWSLRHVERTYACTVAKCPGVIPPGETAEVEVEYRAGGSTADDRRAVELYFHESYAPVARLEVKVAIRPAIAPSRKELIFRGSGKSFQAHESFEVENFSGADWASLGVTADAPWASASAELCRVEESAFGPHQVWEIHVRVDAGGVKAGRYNTALELRGETAEARLPMWLDLARPVTAVPERLFFGNIDVDGKGTCVVRLNCAACTAKELLRRLVVRHDLGERLSLDLAVRSTKVLELAGSLRLPENSSAINGFVVLEIGDADATRIELPVIGER
jgi:hypothetical protein